MADGRLFYQETNAANPTGAQFGDLITYKDGSLGTVDEKNTIHTNVNVPMGGGIEFYGSTPPAGYLFENGAAVSRTTYANLFALIGTTYGAGNGSTTFNLPDRRGKVGVMQSTEAEFATLGKVGGNKNMQVHTHAQNAHNHTQAAHNHNQNLHAHGTNGHNHRVCGWTFGVDGTGAGQMVLKEPNVDNWAHGTDWRNVGIVGGYAGLIAETAGNYASIATNQNAGAGNAQNLQPYLVCNFIIKY